MAERVRDEVGKWSAIAVLFCAAMLSLLILFYLANPDKTISGGDKQMLVYGSLTVAFLLAWAYCQEVRRPVETISWITPTAGMRPSELMNWRVRFSEQAVGRERQKAQLVDWARAGGGVKICFLSGPCGAGKMRLVAEVALELGQDGWRVGVAKGNADELMAETKRARQLLIVESPEDDPERAKQLLLALGAISRVTGSIRAVFVSQYSADRWEGTFGVIDEGLIASDRGRYQDGLALGELSDEDARCLFEATLSRYSDLTGKEDCAPTVKQMTEWLENGPDKELFHLPLFLTAAALYCAAGREHRGDLSAREVMEELAQREMDGDGWQAAILALAAVRGGLSRAELKKLTNSPPDGLALPTLDAVVDWANTYGHWKGGALAPLEPLPLAAVVVRQALGDEASAEWLWSVLRGAPTAVQSKWPEQANRLAEQISLLYGDENFLDTRLATLLEEVPERAASLMYVLDRHHLRGLQQFVMAVGGARLRDSDLDADIQAMISHILSTLYGQEGMTGEALELGSATVEQLRELVKRRPKLYEPTLAGSLANLAVFLHRAGREEEALTASDEAIEISRRLAGRSPEAYEATMASAIGNRSGLAAEHDDHESAAALAEECLAVTRRVAQREPRRSQADLAGAIEGWLTSATEPRQEAERTAAAREAVGLYRQLLDRYGNRYQGPLAMSLNNLASFLSDQDLADEALVAVEECAGLYKRLPACDQDDSTTVVLLGTRAICMLDVGLVDQAEDLSQAGIARARSLPEADRELRVSDLALCLYVKGCCMAKRGDETGATMSLEEALQLMQSRRARDVLCTRRYVPKIKTSLERLRDANN